MKKRLMIWACLAVCAGVAVDAREVALTILNTTDLHGRVLTEPAAGGSLLQCAALIRQIRQAQSNLLLVDCGDLIQGSAESFLSQGRIMTRALEQMNYDAWVLGNHDFDWGIGSLARLVAQTRIPVLAANYYSVGATNPLPRVRPFIMRELDGVRVAIVGLTTPGIPTWIRPEFLGPARFACSVETLKSLLPTVRERHPDIMILLVHQGYQPGGDDPANELGAITRQFPDFDVVLGGHQHTPIDGTLIGRSLYLQAGAQGGCLGRVDLVYDTVRRELTARQGRLVAVGAETPEDPELADALADDLQRARQYLDEPVGAAAEPIEASSRGAGDSPIQQLIARAIARAVRADVVIHGQLSGASLAAGPITRRDIWAIVPYENRVGVLRLTPAEIRAILDEAVPQLGGGHSLPAYGLNYEIYPDAPPGQRIRTLRRADGRSIHPRKRLRVAFNSYTLASGGGRFPTLRRLADQPVSRLELTKVDTRNAVTDYVRLNSPLRIAAGGTITVVRTERSGRKPVANAPQSEPVE